MAEEYVWEAIGKRGLQGLIDYLDIGDKSQSPVVPESFKTFPHVMPETLKEFGRPSVDLRWLFNPSSLAKAPPKPKAPPAPKKDSKVGSNGQALQLYNRIAEGDAIVSESGVYRELFPELVIEETSAAEVRERAKLVLSDYNSAGTYFGLRAGDYVWLADFDEQGQKLSLAEKLAHAYHEAGHGGHGDEVAAQKAGMERLEADIGRFPEYAPVLKEAKSYSQKVLRELIAQN
jgi:hypothetical protein